MKKDSRLKIAKLALFYFSCGTAMAANVTQINRYATVENKPLVSQINPLLTVQQIHFPQQVRTVGEALTYWLQYSGFSLADEDRRSSALKDILQQPLPQVDRNLGPLTVQDGLEVLVGQQVFSLSQDPLHRKVNFRLKPAYAQLITQPKAPKPRGSAQQQITVREPLIRRDAAPSPRVRGEGKNEEKYLEGRKA